MLTVYTDSWLIPKDLQLITLTDNYFRLKFINDLHEYDDIIKRVISNVDGSTYLSGDIIRTRFGTEVSVDKLSSGCKTLINAYTTFKKDKNCKMCFSTIDCGNNALLELLKLPFGIFYMPIGPISFENFDTECTMYTMYGNYQVHSLFEFIDGTRGAL